MLNTKQFKNGLWITTSHEKIIEHTRCLDIPCLDVKGWSAVLPHIQSVINPVTDPVTHHGLVAGARLEFVI